MAADVMVINLEDRMPTKADAEAILVRQLSLARQGKFACVKLIHGYGSSGKGGILRTFVRDRLQMMMKNGTIAFFVPGEEFSVFSADSGKLLEKCPSLRRDQDLNKGNRGITFILLTY